MTMTLLLTGMHRSGTSLLAQVALRAGIDMGARLMEGSKGNRRGHFEDLEFVHFHERFLESRGVGSLAPPADWSPRPTTAEEAEARELVARRASRPLWGFKDPRTSLFLPFWEPLLPDPRFVLLYRHPVEVAMSLLRRGQDLQVHLDPGSALRAWTVYNSRLLEFRLAHPERCRLWSVAGVARSLPAAVHGLGELIGRRLDDRAAEGVFDPGDLQAGLWARGIDWDSAIPEAMALFRRLEAVADLPAGPELDPVERGSGPSRRERDLLEVGEHLLAAALRPEGGAPQASPVTAQQRVEYSDLRQVVARHEERIERLAGDVRRREEEIGCLAAEVAKKEEEIRRLEGALRERDDFWTQVQSTRSWKLANAWWSAAARVRSLRLNQRPAEATPRSAPSVPGEPSVPLAPAEEPVRDTAPRAR